MFRAPSQEMLKYLLKKAINDCSGNTNCVSTLIKFMDKKEFWASYIIDSVKGTFDYVVPHALNQITVVLKNLFHSI